MKYLFLLLPALLFCFPAASFAGARDGLLLWFESVLPSLLPCLILSDLCIRFGITAIVAARLKRVGRILFGLSPYGCYPAFLGFLSGLPAGAKAASDLSLRRDISRTEAEYIVALCNNVSPMFLINYAASDQLGIPAFGPVLCAIVWISSILSARLLFCPGRRKANTSLSAASLEKPRIPAGGSRSIIEETDEAILDSFRILVKSGGYIILFSVLSSILHSVAGNGPIPCILSGVLETTTGIHAVAALKAPLLIRIPGVAAAAAFGGLSGLAQTLSVTTEAGLRTGRYLAARLLSALFAAILARIWCLTWL